MKPQHFDVLIIGAGLSGIGMACHMKKDCPNKSYAIIERRDSLGGTWDLFKYPGIRSDSDMYTFGYNFRPWKGSKVLADGPSIKNYIKETAEEYDVLDNIKYGLKVVRSSWSSSKSLWTLSVENEKTGEKQQFTANFVVNATGYYNYDEGYKPDYPGEADYQGQLIHPQHWPEDLDYSGKKIVVIGSGATAVTVVPAMADDAAHVTMLQRSPTYMLPIPMVDPVTQQLQRFLPDMLTYRITRTRNITALRTMYQASRRSPKAVRRLLLGIVRKQLGNSVDMRHFSPKYNPWDERLCAVSDGDLFKALRSGKASMETDTIKRFTEKGILLESGKELEADIVISATGLNIQLMGGIDVRVDSKKVKVNDTLVYKNVLASNIPNAGLIFGYTNLPWTLKADIAAEYICRLLNHMDKHGYNKVEPRDLEGCATDETVMGALQSGYIKRAADKLPRQGTKAPWAMTQDYIRDTKTARYSRIEDDQLWFDDRDPKTTSRPSKRKSAFNTLRNVVPRGA